MSTFKQLIVIIALFQAVNLQAQQHYIIEGDIQGLEDGTVLSLLRNDGSVLSSIATDTLSGGKFKFTGTAEEQSSLAITSPAPGFPSQWLDIFATPSAGIKITGSGKFLKTWTVESLVKDQIDLSRYTEACRKEMDRLQELSASRKAVFGQLMKVSGEERKKFKPSIDSIDRLSDSANAALFEKEIALMEKLPVTTIWISKLKSIAMDVRYNAKSKFREPALALYSRLNTEQKQSLSGQEIQVALFPPQVVKKGEDVPANALTDLAGKKHYLSDYKGKYLLLDFWSIGCGPCIMAMPELARLSSSHKDSLTVISLILDA